MEPLTSDERVCEAVITMSLRWSEEAIVFLDGEDHSEYATGIVIAACIQMARAFMSDDNEQQRANWVRLLSAEGVELVEVSKTQ